MRALATQPASQSRIDRLRWWVEMGQTGAQFVLGTGMNYAEVVEDFDTRDLIALLVDHELVQPFRRRARLQHPFEFLLVRSSRPLPASWPNLPLIRKPGPKEAEARGRAAWGARK